MWAFIAFVSSNILWLLIGVFIGGAIHGYKEIKDNELKDKEKEEDTDEVQSAKS